MNLFSLGHALEGLSPLSIDSDRCCRLISPLSQCHICEDICPKHALAFSNNHWQSTDCLNCGLCVAACPQQVFSLDEGLLLAAADKYDDLSISCRHCQGTPIGQIQISCFQQLYPELLFRLLENVQSLKLYYNQNTCDNCPNHWLAQSFPLQLKQFHLPFAKLSLIDCAQDTNVSNATDRRHFFLNLFSSVKTTAEKAVAKTEDFIIPLSLQKGNNTREIIAKRVALRSIYQNNPDIAPQQELPYRMLKNTHCTFCGACTALCPTNALTLLTTEQGEKKLSYQPILCTQCNICADICFVKGFYWSDKLTIETLTTITPLILAASDKKICPKCQQEFWQYPTASPYCSFCQE